MNPAVAIAMFGWIPVVLILFATMPPRRAMIVAFVSSWLFLPVVRFPLPGIPDYSKVSATTMGVVLAMVIFDSRRLFSLRPRFVDLPVLIWCLCPIASSLSNHLGLYDGLSAALSQGVTWGLPYLIGRAYLDDLEGLRALAVGVVIGGLFYIPLCLWEIRLSPQLHRIVYGFAQSSFGMTIRFGQYRPMVFMQHGLELGMWMTAASLIGFWLWSSGGLKRVRNIPFGACLLALLATTFLCKSTGSLVLLVLGLALHRAIRWTKSPLPIWMLIAVAPLYETTRANNTWTGRNLVEISRSCFGEERAQSLEFRLDNENLLTKKAMERPLLGWGGWGRARVYDKRGRDLSITDGYWIIALGNMGLVGMISLTTVVLLPVALLPVRHPVRTWTTEPVAPAAAIAVLLGLSMIDNLSNAMFNPIYVLAIGGLTALRPGRGRAGLVAHVAAAPGRIQRAGQAQGPFSNAAEAMALDRMRSSRILAGQGRLVEAVAAGECSLLLLGDQAARFPHQIAARKTWLDAHNDLAWILLTSPEANGVHARRAASLAELAVEWEPRCATYWNTLGLARYRTGEWEAAIAALETSMAFSDGGSSFDYFILAMSHASRGEHEEAEGWFRRAESWMNDHMPEHAGLLRLRAEALTILRSVPIPG